MPPGSESSGVMPPDSERSARPVARVEAGESGLRDRRGLDADADAVEGAGANRRLIAGPGPAGSAGAPPSHREQILPVELHALGGASGTSRGEIAPVMQQMMMQVDVHRANTGACAAQ